MAAPSRDTCKRGHPRTPDNMTNNRECRRCKTDANTLRMRAVREREQPKPKRHCSQGHDQAVHGSHSRGGVAYCGECKRVGQGGWIGPPSAATLPDLAAGRSTPVCGSFPMVADPEAPAPRLVLRGPWGGPGSGSGR